MRPPPRRSRPPCRVRPAATSTLTSRATCASAGFEQFPHHTGHGVGFRLHESRPQLVPGSTHELRESMVIVTEPGVYRAELDGGIRYEDAAVVRPGGAELLGGTDYGFDD